MTQTVINGFKTGHHFSGEETTSTHAIARAAF
jgi:hypothetical protein